jgi:hypothetical protein
MRHAAGHPGRSFELPATLRRGGFDLELVERRGDRAIYRQIKEGKIFSFEAVIIKKRAEHTLPGGTRFEAAEVYPSDRHWGSLAWTCMTMERAYERLGWDQAPTNHS